MADQTVESFRPTNGRLVGGLGLVILLVVMALGIAERFPLWAAGLVAVLAVLTWACLLRPAVRIVDDDLELRDVFVTRALPLGAIEEVTVRRVLAVRAGGRRFVSPAIGRSLRETMRPADRAAAAGTSYPDYVEERIRSASGEHRGRLGISARSPQQQQLATQVRTVPAWPELAALALATALLVAGLVLAR